MPDKNQRYGQKGETLAVRYLQKTGYRILEKNYRTNLGEIDIIAKDRDFIVFVEVKARQTESFGNPKRQSLRINDVKFQWSPSSTSNPPGRFLPGPGSMW